MQISKRVEIDARFFRWQTLESKGNKMKTITRVGIPHSWSHPWAKAWRLALWCSVLFSLLTPPASGQVQLDVLWGLAGHASTVNSVACSPDGTLVASADGIGVIRLWRESDCSPVGSCAGYGPLAFSPIANILAYRSGGTVILRDMASGQTWRRIPELESGTYAVSLAFSSDGSVLAVGYNNYSVQLWRLADVIPVRLRILKGHSGYISSLAFSSDGTTLVSGSDDKTVKVWNWNNGTTTLTLTTLNVVTSVSLSPDGTFLAAPGGIDTTVCVWQLPQGTLVTNLSNVRWVDSVAFSPDGQWLAMGASRSGIFVNPVISLWKVSDWSLAKTPAWQSSVNALSFSPNSDWLAFGSGKPSVGKWLYSAGQGTEVQEFTRLTSAVTSVAFAGGGDTLAVGEAAGRLFNVADGSEPWPPIQGWFFAASPDGNTMVSMYFGCIQLWRVIDGIKLGEFYPGAEARHLAVLPDLATFKVAIGTSAGTIEVWTVNNPNRLQTLEGHTNGWLNAIAVSPSGGLMASAGGYVLNGTNGATATYEFLDLWDETNSVWCLAQSLTNRLYASTLCLAFSPDGSLLATGDEEGTIKFWTVSDGTLTLSRTLTNHTSMVRCLAFSPDGGLLASGSWDHTLRFWRASDGALLASYDYEVGAIQCLAFHPTAPILAYGCSDAALYVMLYTNQCPAGVQQAPVVLAQPASRIASPGETVTFAVSATGCPQPLSYQWQFNGSDLADGGQFGGATTARFSIANVQPANAGGYSVVITNAAGAATSSMATLTVTQSVVAPTITSQPQSRTNTAGTTATFTVEAIGTAPLSHQWRKGTTDLANGGNVSGAATATLTLANVQLADATNYTVVITNVAGSITSAPAYLTVIVCTAPAIQVPPASATNSIGAAASFTVLAQGAAPLSYQWRKDAVNLADGGRFSGVSTSTLTIQNLQTNDAGNYTVVVTNACGSATSAPPAVLTVRTQTCGAPVIIVQPKSQVVREGSDVVFTVVAQDCGPLKYQWQRNGQNMLNATNATLVVAGAAWSQACYYQVVVSNDFGTATSTSASLAFVDTKWFGKAWISITGPVGATYHIQARPDLVSGSWTNLADVTLSQGPYIFIDNDSARLKQRFYRVVPVP